MKDDSVDMRFAAMHAALAKHVEQGSVAGLVALVSRGSDVHVETIGAKALGDTQPIERDTLFRITSMTKPITAAATMMLVDEDRLHLDDPVDRWLPELANRRVLSRLDAPLDDTVPARRAITVRDLLTFRLGFGQIWDPSREYPIQRAERELELRTLGPPTPPSPLAPDEWIRRFASLPLMHQPGENWMYNTGSHVLGVLLARVTGQPLETFFRERVFEPLGMKDTAFSVPRDKLGRLATCYRQDQTTRKLVVFDGVEHSQWSRPPIFADAAAGLVSSIDDYAAFGQMMLSGAHRGKRLLSEASIASMTRDHLSAEQKAGAGVFLEGRGWGLGVSVVTRPDELTPVPGRFGWDGGYGTSWASHRELGVVGILLTQSMWSSPKPPDVSREFWRAVYA